MKDETKQESNCSRLVSNDLLDSRAQQKRGAETPEQIAVKVLSGCVTYVPISVIVTLELRTSRAIREAVQAERDACAKIAEKSANHIYEAHVGRVSKSIADEIRTRNL